MGVIETLGTNRFCFPVVEVQSLHCPVDVGCRPDSDVALYLWPGSPTVGQNVARAAPLKSRMRKLEELQKYLREVSNANIWLCTWGQKALVPEGLKHTQTKVCLPHSYIPRGSVHAMKPSMLLRC